MLRLSACSLRPATQSTTLLLAARRAPANGSTYRQFSGLSHMFKRPTISSSPITSSLFKNSGWKRFLMTDRPMVQQETPLDWKRLGITAVGSLFSLKLSCMLNKNNSGWCSWCGRSHQRSSQQRHSGPSHSCREKLTKRYVQVYRRRISPHGIGCSRPFPVWCCFPYHGSQSM